MALQKCGENKNLERFREKWKRSSGRGGLVFRQRCRDDEVEDGARYRPSGHRQRHKAKAQKKEAKLVAKAAKGKESPAEQGEAQDSQTECQ
ncbi:hypothetical protein ACFWXH_13815 [Mesorhizobium sp. NPDC059054]|uniref:hypothetical protein n=1 Tax=Mesorhizobium sp. NPDC059054 TaxID=3346711 RepID=UPI003693EEAE